MENKIRMIIINGYGNKNDKSDTHVFQKQYVCWWVYFVPYTISLEFFNDLKVKSINMTSL